MGNTFLPLLAGFVLFIQTAQAAPFGSEHRPGTGDYVVLVHGLDWFRDTLRPMADFLNQQGYETINVRYPSRKVADPQEAADWVRQVIDGQCRDERKNIHLIGHSMGALVVRDYLAGRRPAGMGRVVLLAAPNGGTPLAEPLQWKFLAKIVAPAAAVSCQPRAGKFRPDFARGIAPGVLMGNRPGWFPFLSPFIKGADDGVVPVESGRLERMADFRILATSHTRMPKNAAAMRDVLTFLQDGQFSPLPVRR